MIITKTVKAVFLIVVAIGSPASAQSARFDETLARLRSPEARERLDALRVLREAAYADAIAPVAPLVSDIDDRVQLAAIAAEVSFFQAEGGAKATIVDVFSGVPFSVFARPVPRDLTAALLRATQDDNRQVRLDAAYALGAIVGPPLSPVDATLLAAGLQHPDAGTRAAVARACGRLRVNEAGDALVTAMNDPDGDARLAAIWALGELRFTRAIQALTDFAAHYGTSRLGLAAFSSLARIAHASSAPAFRAGLTDRNAERRALAAEGVGRLRDQVSVPQLEANAAADGDAAAQAAALFALALSGRKPPEAVAMMLADRRGFPRVREYLRELGEPAVRALVAQLPHPEASIRRGVIDVLGMIGGADMANTIWTLQQDPDAEVRDATARALERLKLQEQKRGQSHFQEKGDSHTFQTEAIGALENCDCPPYRDRKV